MLSLILSSPSFASIRDDKLQADFGQELNKVPFFLQYSFSKEYNKDWGKSTYLERKAFLKNYEMFLASEEAKKRADARVEAAKEKARLYEKKVEVLNEKARLRAIAQTEKAERMAEKARQKEFDVSLKNQQKLLEQMRRSAMHGGAAPGPSGDVSQDSTSQGSSQGSY